MANARKCDRCGKYFDPLDQMGGPMMARFKNPILQTDKDIREGKVTRYLIPDCRNDVYVDLCPECTAEFTLFMEGVPLAIQENDFDKPDIPKKKPKSEFETECDLLKKMKKICDDIWAGDPSEMPSYKSSTREEHRL